MPTQANTHTETDRTDEHLVIELGDAADLTRGGSASGIEDKRTPYSE